ncbi:hypothetical protein CDIK_2870 [Cucumispora dikerogammari]|nr:hypothetical protein CDIK_2870 [Cucumispora dikerogammari]
MFIKKTIGFLFSIYKISSTSEYIPVLVDEIFKDWNMENIQNVTEKKQKFYLVNLPSIKNRVKEIKYPFLLIPLIKVNDKHDPSIKENSLNLVEEFFPDNKNAVKQEDSKYYKTNAFLRHYTAGMDVSLPVSENLSERSRKKSKNELPADKFLILRHPALRSDFLYIAISMHKQYFSEEGNSSFFLKLFTMNNKSLNTDKTHTLYDNDKEFFYKTTIEFTIDINNIQTAIQAISSNFQLSINTSEMPDKLNVLLIPFYKSKKIGFDVKMVTFNEKIVNLIIKDVEKETAEENHLAASNDNVFSETYDVSHKKSDLSDTKKIVEANKQPACLKKQISTDYNLGSKHPVAVVPIKKSKLKKISEQPKTLNKTVHLEKTASSKKISDIVEPIKTQESPKPTKVSENDSVTDLSETKELTKVSEIIDETQPTKVSKFLVNEDVDQTLQSVELFPLSENRESVEYQQAQEIYSNDSATPSETTSLYSELKQTQKKTTGLIDSEKIKQQNAETQPNDIIKVTEQIKEKKSIQVSEEIQLSEVNEPTLASEITIQDETETSSEDNKKLKNNNNLISVETQQSTMAEPNNNLSIPEQPKENIVNPSTENEKAKETINVIKENDQPKDINNINSETSNKIKTNEKPQKNNEKKNLKKFFFWFVIGMFLVFIFIFLLFWYMKNKYKEAEAE